MRKVRPGEVKWDAQIDMSTVSQNSKPCLLVLSSALFLELYWSAQGQALAVSQSKGGTLRHSARHREKLKNVAKEIEFGLSQT